AEVHDDNAWAMGGIAAHSGIFSNALDLHQFAFEMIECYHGRGGLINKEVMKLFWTPALVDPESTWALGWDTPSKVGSSAGKYFSKSTVGHLGFTGCSMWIDPEKELAVILLTNRVHPSVDNLLIREFRPIVHNLVMQALGYGI
ncbi:MAG: serine hydrolase, partial [Proteobacteria bacterium]|nr:serine hydrolase [Pseudomonadota bacterium]